MKKLICIAALIFSCIHLFAGPTIHLEVEIGKKSQGCRKIGICKVSLVLEPGKRVLSDESFQGIMYREDGTNNLILILFPDELNSKDLRLDGNIFEMTDEFVMPLNMKIGLGMRESEGIILPGNYEINHEQDKIVINFGNNF